MGVDGTVNPVNHYLLPLLQNMFETHLCMYLVILAKILDISLTYPFIYFAPVFQFN